ANVRDVALSGDRGRFFVADGVAEDLRALGEGLSPCLTSPLPAQISWWMLSAVREFIAAPDPDRFGELALGVFAFQYERNEPYRRFCDRRGRTPRDVRDWREIPAVPVTAFKHAELVVGGLPADALERLLRELESVRDPLLLIGVTHAFIGFIDRCQAAGTRVRLPYGSRIVDTGGTKGRSRSMSRNGLLRAFWEYFGVPG